MLLKQAGCWQNHLRRISKSNMWVILGSVQISWHNKTHTGSYQLQRFLCYTAPEQKGLTWRKEEMLSTHLRFCDSVMNTMEAAWGWIQSFSAQSIGILYDNEKMKKFEGFLFPVNGEGMMKFYGNPGRASRQFYGLCFHCSVRNGFDYWDGLQLLHINNTFVLKCNCCQG